MSRMFFSPRRICRTLLAWCFACCLACALSWQCALAAAAKSAVPHWVYMPAGARAAYIGIHGGTVPVSLLTSRDGTHMVALVGQTGNDFLRTLKVDSGAGDALQGIQPPIMPPLDVSLYLQSPAAPILPSSRFTTNATLLKAGTAVGAMPVVYATGRSFASLNHLYTDSLLFGISDSSPLLEGSVKAPHTTIKKKRAVKRKPLVRGSSETVNP